MNNILDFSDYENNLDVINNPLEKIQINKNSFNETGVSPLTENKWQYLKRNSLEIEKLFFKNNIVTQKNSLTLVQEPGCSCNISPKEITVYNPKNNIEGYQAGQDEYLYKIKIYTSTRGEVIKQAYYECKVADDEALFFIEDNTGDVSKAKMYAKFGSKVLKNNLINITSERSSESLLKKYTGLDDNILKELIKNGIYEEESSIIRIFVTGFYNFMAYIGLPMKALGWICEKLGEGIIEYLSLPESVWNTSSPDYFLKRENILETLTVNPKLISQIRESLVNDPNKIEINDLIPDFLVNNINLGLTSVENLIYQYNEYVITTINNLYDEVEIGVIVANIQNQISQKVALLCGVWNGLIDFIGGLLVFIGQIAQLQNNIGSNLEDYLERFDSFCKVVSDLKIEDVTEAFSKVYDEVINYLKDDTKNDYNQDKIAYFTGFVIAFIATMFIPFTAFAKPLNVINKLKKAAVPTELLEKVSQATTKTSNFVVKAGKETSETALKLIDDIISLLKEGAKAIEEFLQNIWKKIADWFIENKKLLMSSYDKALLDSWQVLAKYFKTEKIIIAANGVEILCVNFRKALVPVDKILMYARGKVRGVEDLAKLEKELAELRNLRQTARKVFDKNPANAERLKELNDVLIKNAKKAISRKERFEKMNFPDTDANNKKLFELILADLNKSVNKLQPHPNNFIRSVLKTQKGKIILETYWVKLPNGKYYMSTIIVK
ncbi:hypothetical protein [Flavobacterium cyclinae]|uniref:hypothetical protein n=1 Tax=Flavobacterium cyclinae TaxID=2895947 RepID=UPI001E4A353C|nr:hypothetical protein [Flavobacterium cyclinae]UGS22319.1 hypothetical protein LOS86_06765 [Flavobacterium cyclinae]